MPGAAGRPTIDRRPLTSVLNRVGNHEGWIMMTTFSTPLRRAIATVCISDFLPEKLEEEAAGFDGVEIFENDLLTFHSFPANVNPLNPKSEESIHGQFS
jgi:hypothetical protein